MAPFNTHFLIAEQLWPAVRTMTTWPEPDNEINYGQFCFGCIAVDVDKVSPLLTQKDTHFFDRTGQYELMATHRSAMFVREQAAFLSRPFGQLWPEAQAFALGYLCHLCVDEVSKYMWNHQTWLKFRNVGPGPAFAALDETARRRIRNYRAIVQALDGVSVVDIIPSIPLADLEATLRGIQTFVRAGSTENQFMALVDMFDKPNPTERQAKRQSFRANIDTARTQAHFFQFDTLIEASLSRSRQRLDELVSGSRSQPGKPYVPRDR